MATVPHTGLGDDCVIFRSSCLRLKGEKPFLLLVEEEAGRRAAPRPGAEGRAGHWVQGSGAHGEAGGDCER